LGVRPTVIWTHPLCVSFRNPASAWILATIPVKPSNEPMFIANQQKETLDAGGFAGLRHTELTWFPQSAQAYIRENTKDGPIGTCIAAALKSVSLDSSIDAFSDWSSDEKVELSVSEPLPRPQPKRHEPHSSSGRPPCGLPIAT
jgi:hypothetical protein